MSEQRREGEAWPPDAAALEVQTFKAEGDEPAFVLLRHPTAPFAQPGSLDGAGDNMLALERAAHAYLVRAVAAAGLALPRWWLAALDPDSDPDRVFGWLPLAPAGTPAIGSVLIKGADGANRALVLLAGERLIIAKSDGTSDVFPFGSEIGLRVVVERAPARDGGTEAIRFTGLAAALPYAGYGLPPGSDPVNVFGLERSFAGFIGFLARARVEAARLTALDAETVSFRALRLRKQGSGPTVAELRFRGLNENLKGTADAYEIFVTQAGNGSGQWRDASAYKVRLSANGNGCVPTGVFRCDPESHEGVAPWRGRRPRRGQKDLEAYLEPEPIPAILEIDDRFDVVQTRFVPGDNPANGTKVVTLQPQPRIRTNDFSAISAYRNLRELFRALDLFQFDVAGYFRLARLPLEVQYRSGITPGPGKDGQTVNGQVTPSDWDVVDPIRAEEAEQPFLEVHLALGDMGRRDRNRWDRNERSPALPLGFGTDPRWIWHEMAHVLLMATLGELEFRFAHSMGDGLAAITGDPASRLADDPEDPRRFYTYPWVFAPRQHDRCVLHGWGWAGLLGRATRETNFAQGPLPRLRRKGYTTEQILSTSLFRMYRCLGGDTVTAAGLRRRASDYSVYLILRAVQLLGDQRVVPAPSAEFFAAALMQADTLTETCPVRDPADGLAPRTGGASHKAIRWAFEAQGMYAAAGSESAPGLPPPVDVYIADRRPTLERFRNARVEHGPGSYVPVALDWAGLAAGGNGTVPGWFAEDAAIQVQGADLVVTVGNRGTVTASGVVVRLWTHAWTAGDALPNWDPNGGWNATASAAQDIGPGGSERFTFPRPGGSCFVLGEAVCGADRSNIDPLAGLAPSRRAVPLAELVAMDNNLGVAVIGA